MKPTTFIGCAIILLSSIAFAQSPPTPPSDPSQGQPQSQPEGQPGGQPQRRQQGRPEGGPGGPVGQGGPGGQGGQGGQQLVQRLMQGDTNGDGKLSAEELPTQFREAFVVLDTNKDGVLDETELVGIARTQGAARGGRGGAGGPPQNFDGAMKQVNRAFKGLNASALDATSRSRDLEQVQSVQAGLLAAKGMISSVNMAPQAKAKYGDDVAKYQLDMRQQLMGSIMTTLAIENAILAGDAKTTKALLETLDKQEEASHESFRPEEDHEEEHSEGQSEGQGEGKPAPKPAAPAPPSGAK